MRGSKKASVLVHKRMQQIEMGESLYVVLSPQFYTLKKEQIPVKYHYQAKKLAPSLFEGFLNRNTHYDYFVFKKGEDWVFVAYDLESISAFLKEKGIRSEQVSKIFFAEQLAHTFENPVALGKKEALVLIDDTVTLVPAYALEQGYIPVSFAQVAVPRSGVSLYNAYGSLLSLKQALILSSLLSLFALLWIGEGIRIASASGGEQEQMEELLAANPSLQSSYARENVFQKYKTLDTQERKKRETIKTLSGMVAKDTVLNGLQMDAKQFKAEFGCKDDKTVKALSIRAQKEHFKASAGPSGSHTVIVEGML